MLITSTSSLLQDDPPPRGASILSPFVGQPLIGFSLHITARVPTFYKRARITLVPTGHRVPSRQYTGFPSTSLGVGSRPQFRHHLKIFDACVGSLSAHLRDPHLTYPVCLFLNAHHYGFCPQQLEVVCSLPLQADCEGPSFISCATSWRNVPFFARPQEEQALTRGPTHGAA